MTVGVELRLVVRAFSLVIFVCVGAQGAARAEDGAAQPAGASAAALEALRGHARLARAILTSGNADPTDPAALVVLASMALDEGNTREAAQLVARLRAVAPGAIEGRVLDALVKGRGARPQGDWISAGIDAIEAAQPLPPSEPLVAAGERTMEDMLFGKYLPFPVDAAAKLSVPDRFLARWAWPRPVGEDEALAREALRLAASDERPLVLLAVMDVLATATPTPGRPRPARIPPPPRPGERKAMAGFQGCRQGRRALSTEHGSGSRRRRGGGSRRRRYVAHGRVARGRGDAPG